MKYLFQENQISNSRLLRMSMKGHLLKRLQDSVAKNVSLGIKPVDFNSYLSSCQWAIYLILQASLSMSEGDKNDNIQLSRLLWKLNIWDVLSAVLTPYKY